MNIWPNSLKTLYDRDKTQVEDGDGVKLNTVEEKNIEHKESQYSIEEIKEMKSHPFWRFQILHETLIIETILFDRFIFKSKGDFIDVYDEKGNIVYLDLVPGDIVFGDRCCLGRYGKEILVSTFCWTKK